MPQARATIVERRRSLGLLMFVSMMLVGVAHADVYTYTSASGMRYFSNERIDKRYKLLMRSPDRPAVTTAATIETAPVKLRSPSAYDPIIEKAARLSAIPPALLRAVIAVESGFNPNAISHRGAVGLMQLMPDTARRYGVQNPLDPAANIQGGARYLGELVRMFDNDLELALAAYNAGEGAVMKAGNRVPPFYDTQQYVPSVLRTYRSLLAQEQ